MPNDPAGDRLNELKQAFDRDNYDIATTFTYQGKIGAMAKSRNAFNYKGEPKKVYYVEGNNYQMGYLLGRLAEPEVGIMTTTFAENVILEMIGIKTGENDSDEKLKCINDMKKIIIWIVYELSKSMEKDIPAEYVDELKGILQGCKDVNKNTQANWDGLWALNFGFDCLLSHAYTGKIFADHNIDPALLRIPFMCNAYSICGEDAQGKHYFGRDFMFATGGVFQDLACLLIYNPDNAHRMVSSTAPGMIGTIAGMSDESLSIGIDMNPSAFCDPGRPGFNSLLLARHCLHHSDTIDDLVQMMIDAQRGVSWFYAVADGKSGRSCVIEAGAKTDGPFPYLDYVPECYKKHLPDLNYISKMQEKYGTPLPQQGLMVRWDDYTYPMDYINDFNPGLWEFYNGKTLTELRNEYGSAVSGGRLTGVLHERELEALSKIPPYNPADFGERGYIDKTYQDKNVPSFFYFAPQRETKTNLSIVSNHCITPEMRLTAMTRWIGIIAKGNVNDIQWRYDELNNEILTTLDNGPIDEPKAVQLIDFLAPGPLEGPYARKFPDYYNSAKKDWRTVVIGGTVSLCELTAQVMQSHFGYYGDDWAKITLPFYCLK